MVISISGTHCTGKTTLVEKLKQMPEFKDVVFLKSTGKGLQDLGLKINEDGDYLTQLYIICKDIIQIIENKDKKLVICDRCFIDTYLYSYYLYRKKKLTNEQTHALGTLIESIETSFNFIDRIFLLKPTFEPQEEPERSLNLIFQKEIEGLFDDFQKENSQKVEYLPNKDDQRINRIKEYLNL